MIQEQDGVKSATKKVSKLKTQWFLGQEGSENGYEIITRTYTYRTLCSDGCYEDMRTILFQDVAVKIGVYLIGVMIGSVICDLFMVPKSYFSNKGNVFNQYFVKLGWGWTLCLVSLFIYLTTNVYCSGKWTAMRRHGSRMLVATFQWYFCVNFFRHIENNVGVCTDNSHASKNDCIANEKGWLGFDISGHTFLLMHCMLVITEEMKPFREWKRLKELMEDDDLHSKRKVTSAETLLRKYNLYQIDFYRYCNVGSSLGVYVISHCDI